MIKDSINGASYFFRGLSLITQPGVRQFVIIPLILNIVIFAVLIGYGYQQFGELLDWLLPDENSWLSWLNWLRWILIPIFVSVAAIAVFFLFTIVANFVGAPFNSLLAEAVERRLTGNSNDAQKGFSDIIASIGPTMISELKKMLYYIVLSSPFVILFVIALVIPILNLVASFAWLLVTAWILSVQYADYPFDNHDVDFSQLRQRLGQKRFMAFGFGGATMLMMAIPIVNFIVMPTAVAGATAMALEKFGLDKKENVT